MNEFRFKLFKNNPIIYFHFNRTLIYFNKNKFII